MSTSTTCLPATKIKQYRGINQFAQWPCSYAFFKHACSDNRLRLKYPHVDKLGNKTHQYTCCLTLHSYGAQGDLHSKTRVWHFREHILKVKYHSQVSPPLILASLPISFGWLSLSESSHQVWMSLCDDCETFWVLSWEPQRQTVSNYLACNVAIFNFTNYLLHDRSCRCQHRCRGRIEQKQGEAIQGTLIKSAPVFCR